MSIDPISPVVLCADETDVDLGFEDAPDHYLRGRS